MFLHTHPYPPFLFKEARRWIVGTLPPPRFTTGELKPGDVDFCYGSRDGQLWPILDRIYSLGLSYENTGDAIDQRKRFLQREGIGICDIVASAKRQKVDASDFGMQDIELRDLVACLKEYPGVTTLLFTGGNSKNGPEFLFRKLLAGYGLKLRRENATLPRLHTFELPDSLAGNSRGNRRVISTVSLTPPSGAANRAVGSLKEYKELKMKNPEIDTIDFRVLQYKKFF